MIPQNWSKNEKFGEVKRTPFLMFFGISKMQLRFFVIENHPEKSPIISTKTNKAKVFYSSLIPYRR
jgi:hypothetical protein